MRGGHLRVGSEGGSNTDSMDPRLAIGTNHLTTGILSVYDTLVGIGADGAPYGVLAESWEASSDAKTWRFKIRQRTSAVHPSVKRAPRTFPPGWHVCCGSSRRAR